MRILEADRLRRQIGHLERHPGRCRQIPEEGNFPLLRQETGRGGLTDDPQRNLVKQPPHNDEYGHDDKEQDASFHGETASRHQ